MPGIEANSASSFRVLTSVLRSQDCLLEIGLSCADSPSEMSSGFANDGEIHVQPIEYLSVIVGFLEGLLITFCGGATA